MEAGGSPTTTTTTTTTTSNSPSVATEGGPAAGVRKSTRKSSSASGGGAASGGAGQSAGGQPNPLALASRKKNPRKQRVVKKVQNKNNPSGPVAVDLSKLDLLALKRYKKHYKLRTRHKTSRKADLVQAVSRHFAAQSVDENDTIERFVFALKTRT